MTFRHFLCAATFCFSIAAICGGCSSDVSEGKKNLFDEEHFVPAHWPNNVQELAIGFESRMLIVLNSQTSTSPELLGIARKELVDLVAWAPEVTADSPLPESQWIPIYELVEQLNRSLKNEDDTWSTNSCELIQELSQHLQSAATHLESLHKSTDASLQSVAPQDEELR